MTWSDIFLLCFCVGALWSFASLLLGGLHSGHLHLGHGHHLHAGHAHHVNAGHAHAHHHGTSSAEGGSWLSLTNIANPSCLAIFLCWFGGVGYLLLRHSGFAFWLDLVFALVVGLIGAYLLAAFLGFLQSRDKPMDPADYDMIGTLGRVSSPVRTGGVGEMIYTRDGGRCLVPIRSDDGHEVARDAEVIVTRYEKGIAYVRTWEAMTQRGSVAEFDSARTVGANRPVCSTPESLPKENSNVE